MGIAPPSKLEVDPNIQAIKEVILILMEASNLPVYRSGPQKIPTGEVSIEVDFDATTVSAPFMQSDPAGHAIIMRKFRFRGEDLSRSLFVFRITDSRLGLIGEICWSKNPEDLTVLDRKHKDSRIPYHFIQFLPSDEQIEHIQRDRRVKWNGAECQLKVKAYVARFKRKHDLHLHWTCACPLDVCFFNPFRKHTLEEPPIITPWHFKDGKLEKINMDDYPDGWKIWSGDPDQSDEELEPKITRRSSLKRQAFAISDTEHHENSVNLFGKPVQKSADQPSTNAQLEKTTKQTGFKLSEPDKMATVLEKLIESSHDRQKKPSTLPLSRALDDMQLHSIRPSFVDRHFRANALDIVVEGGDATSRFATELRQAFSGKSDSQKRSPVILSFAPNRVPIGVLTQIMISGQYLGTSATDIIALSVCGVNCLSTLRYYNECHLACSVRPVVAAVGALCITTGSGGKNMTGETLFEFYEETEADRTRRRSSRKSSVGREHIRPPKPPLSVEAQELEELYKERLETRNELLKYFYNLKRVVRENDPELYAELEQHDRNFVARQKRHKHFHRDNADDGELPGCTRVVFPVPGVEIVKCGSFDDAEYDPMPAEVEPVTSSQQMVHVQIHEQPKKAREVAKTEDVDEDAEVEGGQASQVSLASKGEEQVAEGDSKEELEEQGSEYSDEDADSEGGSDDGDEDKAEPDSDEWEDEKD